MEAVHPFNPGPRLYSHWRGTSNASSRNSKALVARLQAMTGSALCSCMQLNPILDLNMRAGVQQGFCALMAVEHG